MTNDFTERFRDLLAKHAIALVKPVGEQERNACFESIGPVPPAFVDLYGITNGFCYEWFRILPIKDVANPKKTWDSIQKANDPKRSKYFHNNPDILKRFMIFAEISGGNCALLDRNDMSIWYQENDLHQTDLVLFDFVETEIREVDELN
jgi:hypothetical protein